MRLLAVWLQALELYDHRDDQGDEHSGEHLEYDNLAYNATYHDVVGQLHEQLKTVVRKTLVPPMIPN